MENQTLLILGAGMIGQGLVRAAIPKVKKIIWCYHINRPDVPVCGEGQIELCTFNSVKDQLHAADLIVSATEAPGYVLHSGHAPFFDQEKPLCLIDLGMPRNIDPALNDLSIDLHLVDLDGLKHWHHRVVTDMDAVFARCRHFIEEHQEQYDRIIKSFQGGNAG